MTNQGAVSLTFLSLLREGFTPIFCATLSYGRKSVSPKENWRNFSHKFRQAQTIHNFLHSVNMAVALVVFENERNDVPLNVGVH